MQQKYGWETLIGRNFSSDKKMEVHERCEKIQNLFQIMAPELHLNYSFDDAGVGCSIQHLKDDLHHQTVDGNAVFCEGETICNRRKVDDNTLEVLAQWLDQSHEMGLVYGGLKAENLLFTHQNQDKSVFLRPFLLNWNPVLNPVQACHPPHGATWIDPIDQLNAQMTARTDWLCLHRLIVRKPESFYRGEGWQAITQWLADDVPQRKAHVLSKMFISKTQCCATKLEMA